jgi:hypothetical protein
MTLNQRYKKWQEFVKMIMESTPVQQDETQQDQDTRIAHLEADPEEWFKYYFPRFAYSEPADFHKEATQRILENREWYEVRMWSRELAKSTRTMMEVFYLAFVGHPPTGPGDNVFPFPAYHEATEEEEDDDIPPPPDKGTWLIPLKPLPPEESKHLRLRKRYILLISNSLENAERLLMPYKANLEFNQRLIQDYGPQQSIGTWQAGSFTTIGGIAFRALGAGQSPRGARNEEVRPDIILFDDIDTDADCLNPELVAKKWRWIEEAAIGTRSVSLPTTIIFCGNRIAVDTCVGRAADLADHSEEINIRDKGGNSSWPQKNQEVDIDRVLSQKSYAAQQKEYFNNPITEGSVFKEMAYKPVRQLSDYKMLVCYTDPSYRHTNDYKATILIGKYNHEFHIIKCYLEQATTAAMIDWHFSMMNLVGSNACYYYMEDVFMQDVLIKEVSDAGKRHGRPIPIRGDRRQKPDKFMRIESLLEPLHRNGELYLNETEKHNPHMQRLAEQFMAFAPGSRAHDDGPYAVEGAIWIINESLRHRDQQTIQSFRRSNNDNKW